MSLISEILPIDNIVLDNHSATKQAIFERAGLLFANKLGLPQASIVDSLLQREKLGSTGLGRGVAIPHGRIARMREATAAFIKLSHGVPFDAPDRQPVQLVFVLLVPDRATDLHLQILGELAEMFSDSAFRQQLLDCTDVPTLHRLMTGWRGA